MRGTDTNDQKDHDQLQSLNALKFNNPNYTDYWMASRKIDNPYGTENHSYGLRTVKKNGTDSVGDLIFVYILSDPYDVDGNDSGRKYTSGFRPVIRLLTDAEVTSGDGTSDSPYELKT